MIEPAVARPAQAEAGGSLADLVRRAARADQQAFALLVDAHADRAFRIARAILGNETDARDATQEAFVAAWRDLRALRDPASFEAWFRRILVNVCNRQARRRRRVNEVTLDETFDIGATDTALSDQVTDTVALARAFHRLDGRKRSILVLHYLAHEPIASISATLGIPEGTVKSRLSEARSALARALVIEGGVGR